MASQPLTETDATRFFVQPKEGENLPSLLKRCIPQVQTKRARAYNSLEQALRISQRPNTRSVPTPPTDPSNPFPPVSANHDYSTVCANVTEDLKLCSEAVIELRAMLVHHERGDGPLRDADPGDVHMVLKWLDKLQELEERKLVATVSKHVLYRSKSIDSSVASENQITAGEIKGKVAKYLRELSSVDEMINELLQEMREYFLELEE